MWNFKFQAENEKRIGGGKDTSTIRGWERKNALDEVNSGAMNRKRKEKKKKERKVIAGME